MEIGKLMVKIAFRNAFSQTLCDQLVAAAAAARREGN